MNRRSCCLLAALLAAAHAVAAAPITAVDGRIELPAIERSKLLAEDAVARKPGPVRYALGREVLADAAAKAADWQPLADGRWRWAVEVAAPGARSLDFGFGQYRLPAGAELWLLGLTTGERVGPFDDSHNAPGGEFWTPLIADAEVRIELTVPEDRRGFAMLRLDTVHQGYRAFLGSVFEKTHDSAAGACNLDVACPEGNAWREPIRSVAAISFSASGSRHGLFCSGQFVRSTAAAVEPLFLSANHCGIRPANAASVVAYLNFENSHCRLRGSAANGQNGDGVLGSFVSGATVLAQADATASGVSASDFLLLRFNALPPAAANVFFSGWDRRDQVHSRGVGIHHPSGDEKRISFDEQPQTITDYGESSGSTHLRVGAWDLGTTEPGSSGSGLWNAEQRLVGVLSGGAAACAGSGANDNNQPDWYGRLAHAWNFGATANRRLRDWLDPGNSGALSIDGSGAATLTVTLQSSAFTTLASAGEQIAFEASVSGGSGPFTYQWDVDGDGIFERSGSEARIEVSFPRRTSTQVRVRVSATGGAAGTASRALDVRGPQVTAAAAGAPVQVCGNNDASIDPGEHWRLPVRLSNAGDLAMEAGDALFAAAGQSLPFGPNGFGYRGGSCAFGFVDIAAGVHQVPALPLDDDDDGRTDLIALGGSGVLIYGERRTQAVMSTNGYLSFSAGESGQHYDNDCALPFDDGAEGPQLRPLHDDLVADNADAGLRYRYFTQCPRTPEVDQASPQGCHVFQWSGMRRFGSGGSFEFQALAYERSGQVVYQYRSADPLAGGSATIGLIDGDGVDPLHLGCDATGRAAAQSALCIYAPTAQPLPLLRLPQATQAFGGIAPGASVVVELPFDVPPDAACGAPLAIDYIASLDHRAHWFERGLVLDTAVAAGCQPTSACLPPISDPPPPLRVRPGMYFDPRRDGNGIYTVLPRIDHERTIFGGLWYTGGRDHTPTWYEASGEVHALAGEVAVVSYRKLPSEPFPPVRSRAGRAWVGFAADNSLLLAWDIAGHGSGAERMQRVALPFAQPNHSTAWFNPGEDGWGLGIESLDLGVGGELEFIAAYLYDDSGAPRWLAGDRPTVTGGTFAMRGFSPHCPACPRYADVQSRVSNAGPLRIDYTGPLSGLLSSELTLPAPWVGSWLRTNLPIQPIVTPATGAAAE
jgi:lysyl endopeptidase